jgi:hypothetical protein
MQPDPVQQQLDFAPRKRGVGRGSKFFVLHRSDWERVWAIPTVNRLNLATTYLVLAAGTGADNRLSKWSAKSCEQYAGMGKPRAKVAIEELIAGGLIRRTEVSTSRFPQYEFLHLQDDPSPIFMPSQFVMGCGKEIPILRRVRECGDPMLLRMLVDLYGLVQLDATYGVPLSVLRQYDKTPDACRKVEECGANTIWALSLGNTLQSEGEWRQRHSRKSDQDEFWRRVHTLPQIGAIWFEPWVFDSDRNDAEPLFPAERESSDGSSRMSVWFMHNCVASSLVGEKRHMLQPYQNHTLVVLPAHHSPPALRGVCRLRVEADTPGRRSAYAQRMSALEGWRDACNELYGDLNSGRADRPIRTYRRRD